MAPARRARRGVASPSPRWRATRKRSLVRSPSVFGTPWGVRWLPLERPKTQRERTSAAKEAFFLCLWEPLGCYWSAQGHRENAPNARLLETFFALQHLENAGGAQIGVIGQSFRLPVSGSYCQWLGADFHGFPMLPQKSRKKEDF